MHHHPDSSSGRKDLLSPVETEISQLSASTEIFLAAESRLAPGHRLFLQQQVSNDRSTWDIKAKSLHPKLRQLRRFIPALETALRVSSASSEAREGIKR